MPVTSLTTHALAVTLLMFCIACKDDDASKKNQPGSKAGVQLYTTVDEVVGAPDKHIGKSINVKGVVVDGSVEQSLAGGKMKTRFKLGRKGKTIAVRYAGPLPDSFSKDGGSQVIAKGALKRENGELLLVASQLLSKLPSYNKGAPKP